MKTQEADGITRAGILIHVGAGALNGVSKMRDLEQTVRERAYQLWTEGGCQDGHAETHCLTAQRELLSESLREIGHMVSETVDKPKKARKARKMATRA